MKFYFMNLRNVQNWCDRNVRWPILGWINVSYWHSPSTRIVCYWVVLLQDLILGCPAVRAHDATHARRQKQSLAATPLSKSLFYISSMVIGYIFCMDNFEKSNVKDSYSFVHLTFSQKLVKCHKKLINSNNFSCNFSFTFWTFLKFQIKTFRKYQSTE